MRLKENFFDDDVIKILEGIPNEGFKYSNILLKLYLRSLKNDGRLMVNNAIPYDVNMISSVTGHSESTVRVALDLFKNMGLIDVLDNGAIYMLNIQNFIGKSSTEADRQREYDRKIAEEKRNLRFLQEKSQEILEISTPEIEIELETELEKEIDTDTELENTHVQKAHGPSINYERIVDAFNEICTSYPKVTKLSDKRRKAIKKRLEKYSEADLTTVFEKMQQSDFCKGTNGGWQASFDWIFKNDDNILKVLEGNYDNKGNKNSSCSSYNREDV